jgi:protein involved in polysaccharide export with SLBB domain/capsular polysaccharide biosynthesis protein
MNDNEDFSVSAVQKKRGQPETAQATGAVPSVGGRRLRRWTGGVTPSLESGMVPSVGGVPQVKVVKRTESAPANGMVLPFDPLRLVAALLRHWKWLPLAGLVLLVPALVASMWRFRDSYTVTVQLIRREVGTTIRASQLGEAFKPRQVTVATVVNVMQSPKLLAKVGSQLKPPLTARQLLGQLTIKPERDTDLITVTLKGFGSAQNTANQINLYAQEVVALTAQMQSDEAAELDRFLRGQIEQSNAELDAANKEQLDFSRTADFYDNDRETEAYLRQLSDVETRLETTRANSKSVEFRIASFERELGQQNQLALALNKARDARDALGIAYTTNNPVFKDAQDRVAALEAQFIRENAGGSNQIANFRYSENTLANDLYLRLLTLYGERETLNKDLAQVTEFWSKVQEKLKALPEKNQHHARIAARQQSLMAARDLLMGRQREAQVYKDSSPGLYRQFAKATEESVATTSRWKKTLIVSFVALVFGVGAALLLVCGNELLDFRIVSAGDLKRVTNLPVAIRLTDLGGLKPHDLAHWRFRTWSKLLRQLHLQDTPQLVLGFTSAASGQGKTTIIRHLCEAAHDRRLPVVAITNALVGQEHSKVMSLETAVATPALVIRHLREQPGVPLELIYDDTWIWHLENRARWQRAFEIWQQTPVFVLLVELPAITGLDVVFAAEMMPMVLWVASSGQSQQKELEEAMEVVDAGEVKLAAAVLNHEPKTLSWLASFGLFGSAAMFAICCLLNNATAAEATNAAASAVLSASSETPKPAAWQQRFTVGAGDIFHLRIYGRTDSIRTRVTVGPDGRISFMDAQSVLVAGLTVDEMRVRLDQELEKFYKNARTIITPVEWHSKKYHLLGAVVDRGTYPLDRPMTIIEAVARGRGIASGLLGHNTVELADMARAFIVRNGKRLPVDFERLFHQGDLSQNILIEPDDYLYFPSGTMNEVYLLGAVASPGPLGLTSENTLMGVLTVRGGFLPTAYKQRVLVVRGSLEKPETFVINVEAVLTGREKDFVLKPKDIIYVADKPWQKASELAQLALNSFVQAMTTSWVGNNIKPVGSSILPRL